MDRGNVDARKDVEEGKHGGLGIWVGRVYIKWDLGAKMTWHWRTLY